MKRKLTAIVTAVAMMGAMVPMSVMAEEAVVTPEEIVTTMQNGATEEKNIDINVVNFDTSSTADVQIFVTGSGVSAEQNLVVCANGSSKPLINPVSLTSNGGNVITIPRATIDALSNGSSSNYLEIAVMSSNFFEVYKTVTVYEESVPTLPAKMSVSLDDTGDGPLIRTVSLYFDADYVPGTSDYVYFQAYDKNGNKAGSVIKKQVKADYLDNEVTDDGMRAYVGSSTYTLPSSFDDDATTVEVSFVSGGEEVTNLTQTLSFASKYGTFKALELSFDDTLVKPGQTVEGTLTYINTKGERYDVTNSTSLIVNYGGTATLSKKSTTAPTFTVSSNADAGDTVKVTVYMNLIHSTSATLTVADSTTTNKVKLSTTTAKAGTSQSLTFQIVNASGSNSKLSFTPKNVSFRWVDGSDSTANVSFVGGAMTTLATNGTYLANVKSDKPCTGYIELTFSDDSGNVYRLKSDKFTFTDPNAVEKRTVSMTINSTTMTVDGKNKTIDAAPVIFQDRTFVPLRALVEAFGADVKWKQSDNSITVDYDDTTIVMYAGKTTYTVNGKTKTMDVAPYIVADAGRTMVPVRFVGEALGFTVNAVSNPDGTTKSVNFSN